MKNVVLRIFGRVFKYVLRDLLINGFSSSIVIPSFIRFIILRTYGMKIKSYKISAGIFWGTNKVSVGKGTFINYNCFFDATEKIDIGENCDIAMQVTFCTSSHEIGTSERRAGKGNPQPIRIKDGCWIGAKSTILPGVTIGNGCVIAAGSLVNKDCEPNGLYAGVPAKRIKEL